MIASKELVELKFEDHQNKALERSFMSFHRINSSPIIKRKLVLEKDEYYRFVKARTRQRTQFEMTPSEIDLKFDSFKTPFEWIHSITTFELPNGNFYTVFEELDAPNGMTKEVRVTQSLQQDIGCNVFRYYSEAEKFILEKFKEI